MIAEPFDESGACQVTVAWFTPLVALTLCGAVGEPITIAEEAKLTAPLPALLVAKTVKVALVPLVKPLTVCCNGGVHGQERVADPARDPVIV